MASMSKRRTSSCVATISGPQPTLGHTGAEPTTHRHRPLRHRINLDLATEGHEAPVNQQPATVVEAEQTDGRAPGYSPVVRNVEDFPVEALTPPLDQLNSSSAGS